MVAFTVAGTASPTDVARMTTSQVSAPVPSEVTSARKACSPCGADRSPSACAGHRGGHVSTPGSGVEHLQVPTGGAAGAVMTNVIAVILELGRM